MGEVHLALDTRLGRQVALKILPPEFAADPERKRRLLREARAASALNHPNIVSIFDIGCEDGIDYIVMEFISGKPLSRLLPHNGLKVSEALQYAVQIAGALECAHAAGQFRIDSIKVAYIVRVDEHVEVDPKRLDKIWPSLRWCGGVTRRRPEGRHPFRA